MPDWATFAAFAGVVTSALLLLSHASRGVVANADERPPRRAVGRDHSDERPPDPDRSLARSEPAVDPADDAGEGDGAADRDATTPGRAHAREYASGDPRPAGETAAVDADPTLGPRRPGRHPGAPTDSTETAAVSTAALLANVAVSQGLFAVLLLGGAWYAEIPAWAFGVAPDVATLSDVAVGAALGVGLYAANEVGAAAGEQFGLGGAEELRTALAPESPGGWAVLLLVVLPVIAGFEELLFRGALVGVFAAGFDVSPWAMALVASVAFALGHGAQGRVGVLVTGTLGFVLATAFVLTGSLLVVVVAHYLVNALEFVVHEGLGWEWARGKTGGPEPTEPDD
jgi:membrane protease YdiL (CAAX protease family)